MLFGIGAMARAAKKAKKKAKRALKKINKIPENIDRSYKKVKKKQNKRQYIGDRKRPTDVNKPAKKVMSLADQKATKKKRTGGSYAR